jgi:hypothetical protein
VSFKENEEVQEGVYERLARRMNHCYNCDEKYNWASCFSRLLL